MSTNWNKIKKTVKGGMENAMAAGNKYLKIGKVRMDVMNIRNSLNETFKEMGIELYNQATGETKGDIRNNPRMKSLIEKVNKLKQSLKEDELKIEGIKN